MAVCFSDALAFSRESHEAVLTEPQEVLAAIKAC